MGSAINAATFSTPCSSIALSRSLATFIPNSSGQITQSARGTGGGSTTVNFNINTVDARGFNELLTQSRGTITQLINQAVNEVKTIKNEAEEISPGTSIVRLSKLAPPVIKILFFPVIVVLYFILAP